MAWIAHYDQDGNVQTVREHSEQTARLSAESAIEPLRDICYLIGLLHDVGKCSPMFQKRLTDKSITFEHSIAGAKAVEELNSLHIPKPLQHLMQLCIIGHHTGIPDSGLPSDNETSPTLRGRLKRPAGDYAAYKTDLTIPDYPSSAFKDFKSYIQKDCATREEVLEKFAFLVRYCFSCLTDADSIDTAIASGEPARRAMISDFDACSDKDAMLQKIASLSGAAAKCGGQAGTTGQQFAKGNEALGFDGFKNLDFNGYDSPALAVQSMLDGNISFIIVDKAVAQTLLKNVNK